MIDSRIQPGIDSLPLELQESLAAFLEQYANSVEFGNAIALEPFLQEYPQLRSYVERMMADIELLCKIPAEHKSGVADCSNSAVTKGMLLGDFEILREIGRGGMGVVYLAQQRSLQRQVALKMLPFAAILDPNQIARFHTEAQAAASLHHPNIVPVYSVGCERGVHFYSMQYIDGQTMEAFLQSLRQGNVLEHSWADSTSAIQSVGRHDSSPNSIQMTRRTLKSSNYIRQIVAKMADVAMALEFAHSRGIIHRDIKPSNLMMDRGGNLWLTDFGLARIQDSQSVTIDGDLVGTLRYMSPEQANGRTHLVDNRADIYSFGVTLYEMLTLHCAFEGSDRYEVLASIQRAKPLPPRSMNPSISSDLETIIAKCMSPEKDDRYATAGELADDLHRFLNHQPIAARRPSVADRLGKWALRKKKWVAATLVCILMIAIGSLSFAFLIRQQRDRAEMFATNAHVIVDRFGSDFADQLEGIPGTEEIRRNILRETSDYYSQLIRYSSKDPLLARQAARAAHRLASISLRLGNLQAAVLGFGDSLRRWESVLVKTKWTSEDIVAIAECHRDFAKVNSSLGDMEAAREHFQSALALLEKIPSTSEYQLRRLQEVAKTRSEVSLYYAKTGNPNRAVELLEQSVIDLEKAIKNASTEGRSMLLSQIVFALNNHASIILDQDPAHASSLLRRAEQLQIESNMNQPLPLPERMLVAIVKSNLGVAERKLGSMIFAEEKFQQA
ncbi:MAG: serine/threonine-protein kinase, partial [Planctomycetes bacterium]|nr:serine/threonine-protein kinase [Planctomycetota bacterium]